MTLPIMLAVLYGILECQLRSLSSLAVENEVLDSLSLYNMTCNMRFVCLLTYTFYISYTH